MTMLFSNSAIRKNLNGFLLLFVACLSTSLIGCRPENSSTGNNGESDTTTLAVEETLTPQEQQCENWIKSVVSMSHPEQLGIEVESDVILGILNDWALRCGATDENFNADSLKQWLSEEQIAQLQTERFTSEDTEHIRDSIMNYLIWESVAKGLDSDLDRVRKAFDFVVYNMAMLPIAEEFTLTRYQHLYWGMGTAEDRALLFADILRQNRIDTCILRPKAAEEGQEAPWLVGVFLRDGIYLFNTQIGMPIPGPDSSESEFTTSDVATLEEATSDDSLLRKLDIDEEHKFPLTAEQLKDADIEMIGYPQLWMPRFSKLQSQLPLQSKFLLHDGLVDSVSGQGLPSRLIAQSGTKWKLEDLKLWAFPLEENGTESSAPATLKQYTELFAGSFSAYFDFAEETQDGKPALRIIPTYSVARTRTAYLIGEHSKAVQQFVAIQVIMNTANAEDDTLSVKELEYLQQQRELALSTQALDNIKYWLATAQMTLGRYEQAGDMFSDYLRSYANDGFWRNPAFLNSIPALALSGKYALAIRMSQQISEQMPEGSLQRHGMELQLKRIQKVQLEERLKEAQ